MWNSGILKTSHPINMSYAYSMVLCPTAFTVGNTFKWANDQEHGRLTVDRDSNILGFPTHPVLSVKQWPTLTPSIQPKKHHLQHVRKQINSPSKFCIQYGLHGWLQCLTVEMEGWPLWVACIHSDKCDAWLKNGQSAVLSLIQTIHRSQLCVGWGCDSNCQTDVAVTQVAAAVCRFYRNLCTIMLFGVFFLLLANVVIRIKAYNNEQQGCYFPFKFANL